MLTLMMWDSGESGVCCEKACIYTQYIDYSLSRIQVELCSTVIQDVTCMEGQGIYINLSNSHVCLTRANYSPQFC